LFNKVLGLTNIKGGIRVDQIKKYLIKTGDANNMYILNPYCELIEKHITFKYYHNNRFKSLLFNLNNNHIYPTLDENYKKSIIAKEKIN
jgi:hypothetical protein